MMRPFLRYNTSIASALGNRGDNNHHDSGENHEAEKSSYVDAEDQSQNDMEKAASESSNVRNGDNLDAHKLVNKLKRQHSEPKSR